MLVAVLGGCRLPEARPKPGELRLSMLQNGVPSGCSGWTTFLDGPVVGRTRNDGYVKTAAERLDLFPILDLWAKQEYQQYVKAGKTFPQYIQATRWPRNFNVFADTQQVILTVAEHEWAPPEAIRSVLRHLCAGNYIHMDLLHTAVMVKAITPAQGRALLLKWLGKAKLHKGFNPYAYPANGRFAARAVEAGMLTEEEGRWIVARIARHVGRINVALLDDCVALGVIDATQADAIVQREMAVLMQHPQMRQWRAEASGLLDDLAGKPEAASALRIAELPKPASLEGHL